MLDDQANIIHGPVMTLILFVFAAGRINTWYDRSESNRVYKSARSLMQTSSFFLRR